MTPLYSCPSCESPYNSACLCIYCAVETKPVVAGPAVPVEVWRDTTKTPDYMQAVRSLCGG